MSFTRFTEIFLINHYNDEKKKIVCLLIKLIIMIVKGLISKHRKRKGYFVIYLFS